jgi:putative tryptophan/tyrosine transport system substrate-binding protein
MRRREFITLLGGAAAASPLQAWAQQGERVRRLAAMMGGRNADVDPESRAWFAAFRKALEELGWVEGRNFRADYRWPSGDIDRIEAIAKEFIDLKPDVLFAGNTPSVLTLLRQTRTIPIVFTNLSDPVGTGVVENLARSQSSNVTHLHPRVRRLMPSHRRIDRHHGVTGCECGQLQWTLVFSPIAAYDSSQAFPKLLRL